MKQIITLLIYCFSVNFSAIAQPGTLDNSFGTDGKVITEGIIGMCYASAIQSDGKIIAAGFGTDTTGKFLLVRYNTDGSLDNSFGIEGKVFTKLSLTSSVIFAVSIQPDGQIVAAGWTVLTDSTGYHGIDIAIVRYNSDGVLDNFFGNEGVVLTSVGLNDYLTDMVLQPDGKIVVTGYRSDNDNDTETGFIVRYNVDGSLDEDFGDQGKLIITFEDPVDINCIAIQPDGKVLIAGKHKFTFHGAFFVVRYLQDGSLDTEFGANGRGTAALAPYYFILNDMIVQADGKIILTGGGKKDLLSSKSMTLVRFESNGLTDGLFGNEGTIITAFGTDFSEAYKVLVQPDQKIIIAGYNNDLLNTYARFALVRYQRSGIIDSTFGSNGLQSVDVGKFNVATAAVLQADGKIVAAGGGGIESTFVLARFNGDAEGERYVRIKHWLHHHGFTWEDWPGKNVNYYSVQRSSNGNTFNEIRRLFNRNNQQQFTYEDAAPLTGANYYRLVAVSTDGSMAYSNVIAISNNSNVVKVYPNPAKNNLQVEGLNATQKTKLTITDFNGVVKATAVVTASSYNMNIAQLKQGNYILRMQSNGTSITKKFVKE